MAEAKWIRLKAVLVRDERREAKESMLDANPELKKCILQMMTIQKSCTLKMQKQEYVHLMEKKRKLNFKN